MAGVNKAIIVGNIGKLESFTSQMGNLVVNMSIATSYKQKNADQTYTDVTDWHNCSCFGKVAEIAKAYLTKGKKVYVEGKLKTDKYDKDGQTHYSTKIIVNQLQLLSPKDEGETAEEKKTDYSEYQNKPGLKSTDTFSDDIPF